jgi:transposase
MEANTYSCNRGNAKFRERATFRTFCGAGRALPALSAIARRSIEDSRRLGRHRWKVERTLVWMARYRRLAVRYERREDIHLAFATLAAALLCLKQVRRSC